MKLLTKIAQCAALLGILTGCATHRRDNMYLHDACLESPSSLVMVQISGLEKPGFYKTGKQGLLDFAVSSMFTSGVSEKIEAIDVKPLVKEHYYEAFGDFFANHGFDVTKVIVPLDRDKLVSHAINEAKYAPYDFSALKKKYGARYALVLQPNQFGVERPYHSVIPMGPPVGVADLRVYLVNLEDSSLAGHYNVRTMRGAREWDSPPEYRSLIEAVEDALEGALEDAHLYLCGDAVCHPHS